VITNHENIYIFFTVVGLLYSDNWSKDKSDRTDLIEQIELNEE